MSNPIGAGRKANVQPDYSLWRGPGSFEECGLVVEVKHYKKDAPAKFKEVVTDYARAHPKAEVILVSHGPAREYFNDVSKELVRRCHAIGALTVSNRDERENLRRRVLEYVGDPVGPQRGRLPAEVDAVLVDVSASMSAALRSKDLAELFESFERCEVFLVDTEIRAQCSADEAHGLIASVALGGSTSLREPVADVLSRYSKLLVITDSGGSKDLSTHSITTSDEMKMGGMSVSLVQVSSSAEPEIVTLGPRS